MGAAAVRVPGWTETEECLRSAYREGAPFNPTPSRAKHDASHEPSTQSRKTIGAEVIRELLLCDVPVPTNRIRQVDIIGASITGPLDLRFAVTECPISFTRCTFDSVVNLTEARLRSVSMERCTLPGIDGRHVTVTGDLNQRQGGRFPEDDRSHHQGEERHGCVGR